MIRATCVACLLALLISVGGQQDELQWQDENQQIKDPPIQLQQRQQQQQHLEHQQQDVHPYGQPQQQQQPKLRTARQGDQEIAQQNGEAVATEATEATPLTSGGSGGGDDANTEGLAEYQYAMYLKWLKLQEQQQPDLEPFWQWLPQQHQQHNQQEYYSDEADAAYSVPSLSSPFSPESPSEGEEEEEEKIVDSAGGAQSWWPQAGDAGQQQEYSGSASIVVAPSPIDPSGANSDSTMADPKTPVEEAGPYIHDGHHHHHHQDHHGQLRQQQCSPAQGACPAPDQEGSANEWQADQSGAPAWSSQAATYGHELQQQQQQEQQWSNWQEQQGQQQEDWADWQQQTERDVYLGQGQELAREQQQQAASQVVTGWVLDAVADPVAIAAQAQAGTSTAAIAAATISAEDQMAMEARAAATAQTLTAGEAEAQPIAEAQGAPGASLAQGLFPGLHAGGDTAEAQTVIEVLTAPEVLMEPSAALAAPGTEPESSEGSDLLPPHGSDLPSHDLGSEPSQRPVQPQLEQQQQEAEEQQQQRQLGHDDGDGGDGRQQQQQQPVSLATAYTIVGALEGSGLEDGRAGGAAAAGVSETDAVSAALTAAAAAESNGAVGGSAGAAAAGVSENDSAAGTLTAAAMAEPNSGVVGTGGDAAAGVSETDAAAAALTAAAAAESSRGADSSTPATIKPGADGRFEGVSEADRVAAQAAADVAALGPLRGMKVEDVRKKVKEAVGLIYATTSRRNMSAGLSDLRKLHSLVEAALPQGPVTRTRFAPQTPPAKPEGDGSPANTSDPAPAAGTGPTADTVGMASPPRPPRPLALEVMESRHAGLHAAAAATFQLAALQASEVMPPELLPNDPMAVVLSLQQAARGGSLEALMALAERHMQGIGTPVSCSRGLLFAKIAAMSLVMEVEKEQRYAPALLPVSLRERFADGSYVAAEDAENGEHVISLEEDLAYRGNTDAMRRMAYRRLVGRGMEADPEGAFHDFQAAAALGDPYAIFNIGYMYLRGLHVPQNYTAAREQFEKAAEKGLPSAFNGLGVLAWNGHGMAPNLTAAREAFEKGAARNNSDAVYNLATMHFHGAGTAENRALALELFTRALELGHWRAPYMLALSYEAGAGTEANCTLAMQYYRQLFADRGTWGQQLTAAVKLLDAGDARGALLTYITLAEQGSAAAAANAGWLLRRRAGYWGPDADRLAAKYFQRAAKQGHTGSMVELAHMILAAAPPTAAAVTATATTAIETEAAAGPHGTRDEATAADDGATQQSPNGGGAGGVAAEAGGRDVEAGSAADGAAATDGAAAAETEKPLEGTRANATAEAAEAKALSESGGDSTAAADSTPPPMALAAGSAPVNAAPAVGAAVTTPDTAAGGGGGGGSGSAGPATTAATGDLPAAAGADVAAASAANASSTSNATSTSNSSSLLELLPLVSSIKPPPPPPLVSPAALPSRRAVLGVSTAGDAAAWYRAAAAGGDPEGLFYLGWAHYHGTGVEENATFARLLWLRSFEAAGIRSTRALAPLLALAGMRIDGWLEPMVGPHALARGHAELLQGLDAVRRWTRGSAAAAAGQAAAQGAAAVGEGADTGAESGEIGGMVAEGMVRALARASASVEDWLTGLVAGGGGVDPGNVENTMMLGMVAALLGVLVMRRRRIAART